MLRYRCLLILLIPCVLCLFDKNDEQSSSNTLSSSLCRKCADTDVFPAMQSGCLYFSVDMITFFIKGVGEFNSSVLDDEYHGKSCVMGCRSDNITMQYFYGTNFTFSATFKLAPKRTECSDDMWSMTQFSHVNHTENKLYSYNIKSIATVKGTSFYCNELSFTSTSGDAKVTLYKASIQAFSLNGTTLSNRVTRCSKVYDYDYLTYIISGGMGASVLLAVGAICVSCLSKRWKYGKYNLLDT